MTTFCSHQKQGSLSWHVNNVKDDDSFFFTIIKWKWKWNKKFKQRSILQRTKWHINSEWFNLYEKFLRQLFHYSLLILWIPDFIIWFDDHGMRTEIDPLVREWFYTNYTNQACPHSTQTAWIKHAYTPMYPVSEKPPSEISLYTCLCLEYFSTISQIKTSNLDTY